MSNFSNIGFAVQNEQEFEALMERAVNAGTPVAAGDSHYILYSDQSGAELWLQFDPNGQFLGVNPHYKGESRRKVRLLHSVDRPESPLDGAFYAEALEQPPKEDDSENGKSSAEETNEADLSMIYPFVFDVPNQKALEPAEFPKVATIQLTAFARDFQAFDSEEAYYAGRNSEIAFAPEAFIPSGLFSPDGKEVDPPQAYGIFTGVIKDARMRTNRMDGAPYFWMLVNSLGGQVDVVADARLFKTPPLIGGIVQGQFWLSGRLISE